MRELTPAEQETRDRRRAEYQGFVDECVPVLVDFVDSLGLQDSARIAIDPWRFLLPIESFIQYQDIGREDRIWILTRLGYFIGELFVTRYRGIWVLNEVPDSNFFLQYVVGRFSLLGNPDAMVNPFGVADDFLAIPKGRCLSDFIGKVEEELLSLAGIESALGETS